MISMNFRRGLKTMFNKHRWLFDTNLLLWYRTADPRLPADVKKEIEESNGKKYISIASAWELAIKASIGKLTIAGGIKEFWRGFSSAGFEWLPISIDTISIVETLPFYHKDPFDRILVATSIEHGLEMVATDEVFAQYKNI